MREKIQKLINEYKEKESNYKGHMEKHSKTIQQLEGKIKMAIEGSIQQELKKVELSKNKLMNVSSNVDELTKKISGYMEKFDKIKNEMDENGKKFSNY